MKYSLNLFVMCLISTLTYAQSNWYPCQGGDVILASNDGQCNSNPWELVFEDNFDGASLDLTKWSIPYQGMIRGYDFAREKQWYVNTATPPTGPASPISNNIEISYNSTVGSNTLKIIAKREFPPIYGTFVTDWSTNPVTTQSAYFDFSSANIETINTFKYGRFEIRCKIPKGRGFWPAYWMYGVNPANTSISDEIDVFEFWTESDINLWSKLQHLNIHYPNIESDCPSDYYEGTDFSMNFHTFTLIWNEWKLEWYLDGVDEAHLIRRITKNYTTSGQTVDCNSFEFLHQYIQKTIFPKDPVKLILNLAIENGGNAPDALTPFPSYFEIDYVRIWQQDPLPVYCTANDIPVCNTEPYDMYLYMDVLHAYHRIYTCGISATIAPGNKQWTAGYAIELNNGFYVPFGTNEFFASIEPCLNSNRMTTIDSSDSSDDLRSINIYPNPTNGTFNIELPDNDNKETDIYIYDVLGNIIYSALKVKEQKFTFDMSQYTDGMYFAKVVQGDEINISKIIYMK